MLRAAAASRPCATAPPGTRPARRSAAAPPSMRGPQQRLRAFVGEQSPQAGEYHDDDFEWSSLAEAGAAAEARQHAERAALLRERQPPRGRPREQDVAPACGQLGPGEGRARQREDYSAWECFHAQHRAARFFKERRYLTLAWPALADPATAHVAEIGAGCGSSLLPVLKANPGCRATACDVSPSALRLLRGAATAAGIDPARLRTFAFDASAGHAACGPLAGAEADALLLVFTLSALPPADMPALLRHAHAALRPGGLLLLRDYGLYDMAQLRFSGAAMEGRRLYRRGDGTLAYFFEREALRELVESAGFGTQSCEYACVALRNRKTGGEMRRVFVQGAFVRRA